MILFTFLASLALTNADAAGHLSEQVAGESWWLRLVWVAIGALVFEFIHLTPSVVSKSTMRKRRDAGLWMSASHKVIWSVPDSYRDKIKLSVDGEDYAVETATEYDDATFCMLQCKRHGGTVGAAVVERLASNTLQLGIIFKGRPFGPITLKLAGGTDTAPHRP